jgi:hypothetical protein
MFFFLTNLTPSRIETLVHPSAKLFWNMALRSVPLRIAPKKLSRPGNNPLAPTSLRVHAACSRPCFSLQHRTVSLATNLHSYGSVVVGAQSRGQFEIVLPKSQARDTVRFVKKYNSGPSYQFLAAAAAGKYRVTSWPEENPRQVPSESRWDCERSNPACHYHDRRDPWAIQDLLASVKIVPSIRATAKKAVKSG